MYDLIRIITIYMQRVLNKVRINEGNFFAEKIEKKTEIVNLFHPISFVSVFKMWWW